MKININLSSLSFNLWSRLQSRSDRGASKAKSINEIYQDVGIKNNFIKILLIKADF